MSVSSIIFSLYLIKESEREKEGERDFPSPSPSQCQCQCQQCCWWLRCQISYSSAGRVLQLPNKCNWLNLRTFLEMSQSGPSFIFPPPFPPLISSYFRNNRLLWQNSSGKLISNFCLIFHFLSFAPLITPRTFWQTACTFFTNNQIKSTNYWLLDENSFCTLAWLIELYYLFNEVSLNFPENL